MNHKDRNTGNTPRLGEKMKLVAFLNAYTQGVSGGDLRFIEIMKRLEEERDIELTLVTSNLGKELCRERDLNAVFKVTTREHEAGNVVLLYAKRIISALLLDLEIKKDTILYSTSDFVPDVLPAFFYKFKNKKARWVQVIHHLYQNPCARAGSVEANFLGYVSQRMSFALIRRNADLVIVVNPLVKQQLSRMGFDGDKIFINYNGVNLGKIPSVQHSTKKYDGVFLGRLSISKGVFDLVDIWKNVVSRNPNAKLAIIGGGDKQIEQKLKNSINENKLNNNVEVLGRLADREVFSTLEESKVLVFPSHEEGFGIAVLEAMACGLPVVAWNLPVYKKVFPRGIITVPMGDFKEIGENILKLLKDSEFRNNMSNDALRIASKYSWNDIARQEMLLIEGL